MELCSFLGRINAILLLRSMRELFEKRIIEYFFLRNRKNDHDLFKNKMLQKSTLNGFFLALMKV